MQGLISCFWTGLDEIKEQIQKANTVKSPVLRRLKRTSTQEPKFHQPEIRRLRLMDGER